MLKTDEKTIQLSGTEVAVAIRGKHCDIRNDGTDTVYASRKSPVVAGADGVLSVPAGQSVQLRGVCSKTVHLLGTGSVALAGHDDTEPVFKCAPAGGGGGTVDQVARDTINQHANNTGIHLTAEEVAELVSNENLLINSDFRNVINQRGETEYTGGYSIDCWKCGGTIKLEVADGYIDITQNTSGGSTLTQYFEAPERFAGENITISVCCQLIEGDGMYTIATYDTATEGSSATDGEWTNNYITADDTIKVHTVKASIVNGLNSIAMRPSVAGSKVRLYWVKLEIGEHATQFIAPDPAVELAKCQRYYINLNAEKGDLAHYGVGTAETDTTILMSLPLPATMRTSPSLSYGGSIRVVPSDELKNYINVTKIELVGARFNNSGAVMLRITCDGGLTVGETCWMTNGSGSAGDSSAYIALSAEL